MAEKIYVGKAKIHTFQDGSEIAKIWLTPDGLEMINQNVGNSGGANLVLGEMRQPDRANNTHTLWLDDYYLRDNGNQRQSNQRQGGNGGGYGNQRQNSNGYQNRSSGGYNNQNRNGGGFQQGSRYSADDVRDEPEDEIPF